MADGSNWKRILLHWAKHSGLLERTFYNIEQTDIEVFFEKFRSRMSNVPIKENIKSFLKEEYGEFRLHLDDDNNLSSSDYMYIYSLLLHYSCVKCPEPYFHGICQALPEQFQQAIASFFKIILEKDALTKENLRHAISSASPKSPVAFLPLESPIRTPRSKILPPTPKTNMIEERTKELNSIKAQLESERYEKGFIELQLKQNEEKIQNLIQDQRRHQAEIYKLKNDLLAKNTENCSPNKNLQDEQIKKRLRKDIADKEEAILSLQENLELLKEEKALISEKLIYAEKQVIICLERIKEMDYTINDLRAEVEQKDSTIQSLIETKSELEHFINETRTSSQGFRNDFNMSVECLDGSISRTTNSSGSLISSPENLGVSVVDIKLREKENENITLHEQIDRMKTDCTKLSKHVCQLIIRYSDVFEICNENLIVTDDTDLAHAFMVFVNYLEKFVENYTKSKRDLKSLAEENIEMQSLNVVMSTKISDIENEIAAHKKDLQMLRIEKEVLEQRNESFMKQSDIYQKDIECMQKSNTDITTMLDKLRKDYEELKLKYHNDINRMTADNSDLTSVLNKLREEHEAMERTYKDNITRMAVQNSDVTLKFETVRSDYEKIKLEKSKIEEEKTGLEQRVAELLDNLKSKSDRIDVLEELNEKLLSSIGAHAQEIRQYEDEISELKRIIENLEKYNKSLHDEKNKLEKEINEARNEIVSTKKDLSDTKSNYNSLSQSKEKQRSEMEKLKEGLSQLDSKVQSKTLTIQELEAKLQNSNKEIAELNAKIADVTQNRDFFEESYHNIQQSLGTLSTQSNEKDAVIAQLEVAYKAYSIQKENDYKNMEDSHNKKVKEFEQNIEEHNANFSNFKMEKEKLIGIVDEQNLTLENLNANLVDLKKEKVSQEEHLIKEKENLEHTIKNMEDSHNKKVKEFEQNIEELNANFSNLKMEKEKLIGIVDEQNLTLENLNANLVDLKKDKVSLEEHLTKEKENRKHTIISMQDKHSQFESEIQSILKTMLLGQGDELNVDELGNPVKILREKLNILLTTNNKLNTSGTELRSTITDLRNQITELRRSFEELKEECKNLARKNIESTIKIQSLEAEKLSEIEHLTRKFEAASQDNKTLLSEISSLQVNENTLLSKVKELSEDIEYRAATEVDLTSRISILEEKKLDLANAEVEILVLKNDNAKHVVEVKRLQENAIEMEDSLRKSQSVNVELLNQLDELKTTLTENAQRDTDYINLQLKYVSICAEKERLSEGKLKLEENCSKLTKRVENLSLKLGDLQATAAKLEKTNCESRAEIDSLQKVFNRNKKHSEELQTKLSIAQRDLKAAENKAANVQKSYEEETEKIQSMNQTIDELSLQLENKSLEINEQNAILTEMRSALKSKLATIAKVNTEFTELKSKNDELEEQNQLLTAKVEKLVRLEDALKESQTAFDESLKSLKESQDFAENLQTENETLKAQIEEVNNCAENLKETTSHIDNIKHELELKVEKLSSSLENMSTALESAKVENVELKNKNSTLTFNLETLYEISSAVRVKSELPTLSESTEDIDTKYHKIVQNVNQLNNNNQNLREINCSLAADLEASREENSKFCDNLSKLALKLQILENQNLEISNEMTTLRTSYDTLRVEKENLEKENLNSLATLNELETRQNEILHEHVISQDSFDEKVQQYAADVKEKSETIKELEAKLQEFKALEKVKAKELTTQNEQMVELEKKFESMENQIDREKDMNEKLRKDISIFQAKLFKNRQTTEDKEKKWLEEKNNLLTEIKIAEGRIKDNRLELEGKLEKMKNKMKSLYNDEVTKIRSKHDRDIFEYKTEVKELLVKNEKYESHVHKLAKQMFNLNETILELQKQNKFMETKLKDLESIPSSMLRRHSQFPSQLLNSNLRMEDEEGELFNNTYLADLKNGRVSPFGRDSVCVQELQYRNSLAAPHLRSTYLAQYQDHNVREEDIKDMIPLNLDDSLSSLLHAGQRKKMSGTTSYKKPGPPTPSKNGGRLSFGGSNDTHPREILKDNNEQSICNTKKTTTPAKFRNMFSSSKVKDENTPPRRRLSNLFKSKK